MPYCIVRISPSLASQHWTPLFEALHTLLAKYSKLEKCKSRLEVASMTHLAEGDADRALLTLEIALLPRPPEMLKEIGDAAFKILQDFTFPILTKTCLKAEPTVEIRILHHYWQL